MGMQQVTSELLDSISSRIVEAIHPKKLPSEKYNEET